MIGRISRFIYFLHSLHLKRIYFLFGFTGNSLFTIFLLLNFDTEHASCEEKVKHFNDQTLFDILFPRFSELVSCAENVELTFCIQLNSKLLHWSRDQDCKIDVQSFQTNLIEWLFRTRKRLFNYSHEISLHAIIQVWRFRSQFLPRMPKSSLLCVDFNVQ